MLAAAVPGGTFLDNVDGVIGLVFPVEVLAFVSLFNLDGVKKFLKDFVIEMAKDTDVLKRLLDVMLERGSALRQVDT